MKISELEDNHAGRLEKLEEIRLLLNDRLWMLADENVMLHQIIDNLRSELSRLDERLKVLQHVEPLDDPDLEGWAEKYRVKRHEDNR